jgi:hypothetical protein
MRCCCSHAVGASCTFGKLQSLLLLLPLLLVCISSHLRSCTCCTV